MAENNQSETAKLLRELIGLVKSGKGLGATPATDEVRTRKEGEDPMEASIKERAALMSLKEQIKLEDELTRLRKEQNENNFEEHKLAEQSAKIQETKHQKALLTVAINKESLKSAKQKLEALQKSGEATEAQLFVEHLAVDLARGQVTAAEEHAEKAKELQEHYENTAKALASTREETDKILGKVMLSSRAWENSFYAQAEALGEGDVLKGIGMQMGQIGKTILTSVRPSNLLAQATRSIVDNTVRLVGVQDQALASFNKTSGAAGAYDQLIRDT